ncbi:MAG TPA: PSD1 and planctomycete cytochrome C domain-containing protein [Bryobacteraceae bacterium]|nr:PSD1 and planctomycete cytochrome C domain-containing protein [Bryobacteraceae bacterium]
MFVPLLAAGAWLVPCAPAQQPPDFARDVRPLLESRCWSCHGPKLQMHGLRLDRRADALKGGGSGVPAIVPGDSSQSLLVKYVAGLDKDVVMPPSGDRLKPAEIATLRAWIDGGAVWPGQESEEPAKRRSSHWSFQPVSRPLPPEVKSKWVRNPIDAFLLDKLQSRGWKPAPPAEPRALLRRVYLDLTGLPPTLAEQDAFLKDPSRFPQLVDELLSRPTYGERWGRHWLDLVRYAETNGYERDATKPYAWRYRDYVIRSFNQDKPFDRFILEQLAGDELPDASAETLIALGYYRLGPWDDEPADPQEDRFDQLDDMVSATSQVFLGMTLGCARCHNHKFEPLTARDYYSMVAIFDGLQRPRKGRRELDLPLGTPAQVQKQRERDREIEALEKENDDVSDEERRQRIAALRREVPDLPRGYYFDEPDPQPPPTRLLIRGKAAMPGPPAPPAVPEVLTAEQPQFPPPARTSLRRLTLAKWLASPANPLTARVIVNRVWQHHFGEGLVRTPSDFGVMGEKPTHPELLDWLTAWFVDHGWSIKQLSRMILSSNAYRMSSAWNEICGAADPESRLLWRMPYRRLEVEAIRDSILAVSGHLNPKMGGPSVLPAIPPAALEGSSDPDKVWKPSSETEASRRTVYVFLKRSMIVPMLEVLDLCDTARSAARRQSTSVATQALTLFNGEFVNRQAGYLAERLRREAGADPAKQIGLAWRLALARPPKPSELEAMLDFLERESLEQMSRVIFNLNEFVYAD